MYYSFSITAKYKQLAKQKVGAEIPDDPSKISWKSWIRDQYLPENMKWIVGDMGSISSRKHEMEFMVLCNFVMMKLCTFETLIFLNFGTLNPWNYNTQYIE